MDGFAHRACLECPMRKHLKPMPTLLYVIPLFVNGDCTSSVFERSNGCCSYTTVGIEDPIILIRHGQNTSFNKFDRKLAWMLCFLRVVRFHIRNIPYTLCPFLIQECLDIECPDVGGILAERVSAWLTDLISFVSSLTRILGGYPYWIEVKGVVVRFCEPQ